MKRQVKSLDSMPTPNDDRFVDKPTNNIDKRMSFGNNNHKVVAMSPTSMSNVPSSPISMSPAPSAPNSRSNSPRGTARSTTQQETSRSGGGESPSSLTNKNGTSFLQRMSKSSVVTTSPYSQNSVKGLGLQQNELRILKQSFDRIDEDKNGIIDKLELLHALGEKSEVSNAFVDKVFEMIDFDGDDGINFDEFIQMSGMEILQILYNTSSNLLPPITLEQLTQPTPLIWHE